MSIMLLFLIALALLIIYFIIVGLRSLGSLIQIILVILVLLFFYFGAGYFFIFADFSSGITGNVISTSKGYFSWLENTFENVWDYFSSFF